MKKTILTALLAGFVSMPAFAEEKTDYSGKLLGDWNGYRTKLEDKGITNETVYKVDVMGVASGGIKEGTRVLDNLDVIFNFDGEKLLGAEGLTATLHFLNNNGGHPDADLVGSAQGFDNFETPKATTKVFQAFLEQSMFSGKASVLAGLYDVNSEFNVTDTSGLFINSTFGMGTEFAATGKNGPSTFPFTSVGTRLKANPSEETYGMVAVLDGVPGGPSEVYGNPIEFNSNDGLLMVFEAGWTPDTGKLALGAWTYSEDHDHLTLVDGNGDPLKENSNGAYIIGERVLYTEEGDQGLSGFARLGTANSEVNQFDFAWSTGLVYTGLIPGRDEGQLGLGFTGAHNGDEYRVANAPTESAETTAELTYSDKLTPWLSIQPDLQYIANPGTTVGEDNAVVVGLRLTADL